MPETMKKEKGVKTQAAGGSLPALLVAGSIAVGGSAYTLWQSFIQRPVLDRYGLSYAEQVVPEALGQLGKNNDFKRLVYEQLSKRNMFCTGGLFNIFYYSSQLNGRLYNKLFTSRVKMPRGITEIQIFIKLSKPFESTS